ncbi:MAG: AAA family ATPase [Anaerolineae bacterium]|nr:AAA family ATPase [Anaerolineae bacterium]
MLNTRLHERYRLLAELGQGGMGTVYSAHDDLLDRDVAVKVLSEAGLGQQARARLLAEAKAAARLNHPNIVSVYDAGEAAGLPYIVMELVEGQSLHEAPPRDLDEILSVARQICAALEHAHGQGIVHRDLKPENVSVARGTRPGTTGQVKLMDFGLAHSLSGRATVGGDLLGTVYYLAPEQVLGQQVDGRADLYALGVMLYEMVSGRLPFEGDDPLAVLSQHLHASVVPPSTFRPDLPPRLEAVILRLLAKEPGDRYPSAADLLAELESIDQPADAPGAAVPARPVASVSLLEQLNRGRLVGRRTELAELRGLWNRARQGQGQLVLLSGEPGVGKTRLANEAMIVARLDGAAVLEGGCYEYEMAVPYLPFVEALRGWVHRQEEHVLRQHLGGGTAAELARLAPEIQARLGRLEASAPLPPQEERLRLFDHLARFLQGLAAERGLLLFLDDLHWADQGSLLLLRYLLRALRHDRALILAAYREVELDRAHPLAAALVEWNRDRLAVRIPLARLGRNETATLLAALFGAEQVTDEFAEAIYRETEGNPFFVEEVVKALVEQGQIYREEGRWQRLEIGEMSIPQSVKEAIGRRLSRLNEDCLDVLYAAAPLGKSFSFRELEAVTASGEDALLDAVDEALGAQILRDAGDESFAFTHDKIREVLYNELNPVRRRRTHQRIGEALERLYAGEPRTHVEDLAYHFTESGDHARALRYLRLAGEEAERLYATDEALRHYEQARELAQGLGLRDEEAAIHQALARAYELRGPIEEAVKHYEAALDLTAAPQERTRLKARIGVVYTDVGDERALGYLRAALDEVDPEAMPGVKADILAAMGRFEHYRGQHRRALAFIEEARSLAEPLDDGLTLTEIYTYLAGAYQHLARYDESMDWARASIRLGERKNLARATSIGYEFLAEDSFVLGRWRETLEYAGIEREIGQKTGAQVRVAWAELSRANALYGLGELEQAAAAAESCLALAEATGELRLSVLAGWPLATVEADLGRDEQAGATARLAVARGDELGQIYMLCMSRHALAYWHAQRQEWEPAAALYEECQRLIAQTDNLGAWVQIGSYAVETFCAAGRLEAARSTLAGYQPLVERAGSAHFVALATRARARILAAEGAEREAVQALDAAVDGLAALDSRLELGRALYDRARLLQATGDDGRAGQDLERAVALFQRCGAIRDLERAANLLGRR